MFRELPISISQIIVFIKQFDNKSKSVQFIVTKLMYSQLIQLCSNANSLDQLIPLDSLHIPVLSWIL